MYPTTHSYSYDDVFRLVDQLEVWKWILNSHVSIGEKITSPFRHDVKPGCFLREHDGLILFTDFGRPEYNKYTCVHAVSDIKNIVLSEAATLICNQFMNGQSFGFKKNKLQYSKMKKDKADITFVPFTYNGKPAFTDIDRDYWKPREVTVQDLRDRYVYSVHHFHVNGKYIKPTYPCYAFVFPKTGNIKIYQPNSTTNKWMSSTNSDDVWEWTREFTSRTAIITKSFKDGMLLHKLFPEVDIYAFQSEVVIPKTHIEKINNLYDNVVILYDNDETGIINALNIEELLDTGKAVFYPIEWGKDTDEVYFNKGKHFITNFLTNLI